MTDHRIEVESRSLEIIQGDITTIPADAIVNAANSGLAGGGGVDGAIHSAGGPAIMAELRERYGRRGCPTGSAVVTGAGGLPARWVVHAVGPVWHGGRNGEELLLASAYRTAFDLADELGAVSITFPAISTGVYRYPVEEAAAVAIATVADSLRAGRSIERATFVLYSAPSLAVFATALAAIRSSD